MNERSTLPAGTRSRRGHRYRDDDEPFAHADQSGARSSSSGHRHASASAVPAAPFTAGSHDGFAEHGSYAAPAYDTAEPAWKVHTDWTQEPAWSDGGAWSDASAWSESPADAAPASEADWSDRSGAAWNEARPWDAGDAWQSESAAWTPEPAAPWQPAEQSWEPAAEHTWQPAADATGQAWDSAPEQPWQPAEQAWTETPADDPQQWSHGECVPWETGSWTPDADGAWTPDADSDGTPGDETAAPVVIPARDPRRKGSGAHRMPAPPASLRGRAAVVAVAAGAVVAAGQAAFASPGQPGNTIDYEAAGQVHEIAAQSMSVADPTLDAESPQVLNVSSPANLGQFNEMLEKGQRYAEDLAAREAAKLRPLFTRMAAGTYTSGFGARWGVQHLGIDIAGPIGTPIYAVADGTVIESGPAAGFGMWVRLLHDDGTVTIYGHIDTSTVSVGERVMAGDQIATMGNRGFSTGPHLHFEVWLNGTDKVDPMPWLATRGIGLGPRGD